MSSGNFKAQLQISNSMLNVLIQYCAFCMVVVLFLSWLFAFCFFFFFSFSFFFFLLVLGTIYIWVGKYFKSSHGL